MSVNGYEFLRVSTAEGIATVALNRPPLNILHSPMMAELDRALEAILASADTAALVIRAEGKAFCAGVDVAEHTVERVGEMIRLFHGLFRKLAACDALTIAVVQGAALGGGCELACSCDIVLAADSARFGQPEVQVGAFPPVAACVLPHQVGLRKAVELTALGTTIDAAEARRIGLVSQVFAAAELNERVEQYLEQVGRLSRPVLRMAKRATTLAAREQILAQLERVERMYLTELMSLADAHEGVQAFLHKRPPAWKHA